MSTNTITTSIREESSTENLPITNITVSTTSSTTTLDMDMTGIKKKSSNTNEIIIGVFIPLILIACIFIIYFYRKRLFKKQKKREIKLPPIDKRRFTKSFLSDEDNTIELPTFDNAIVPDQSRENENNELPIENNRVDVEVKKDRLENGEIHHKSETNENNIKIDKSEINEAESEENNPPENTSDKIQLID
jgi:uncharacterized protein YneF (UPF0154 family)